MTTVKQAQNEVLSDHDRRAYSKLCDEGYTHDMINHKQHFVDSSNPNIHTQNIEGLWLDLKQWAKRPGLRSEYFKQYFARSFIHSRKTKLSTIFSSRPLDCTAPSLTGTGHLAFPSSHSCRKSLKASQMTT
ncbi:hypothetical protein E2C01_085822 [Portunus trituberculatus]|uniref:Uncharacterized protein n=1 Tax=Portunus trituberculatus TaxID=210409 RepID=A0A5B7J211_PORTR|nr:hypothetical protein [Portunus trituberculatus]